MKIVKRVSTVNAEKCVGCHNCEFHCPTGAIKVRGGEGDAEYVSPCQKACPAGVNVPGYIALAAAGKYDEAYRLIRRDNPFPSVCGRICTHPCQFDCNRNNYDSSVEIRDIKRFVSDKAFENGVKNEKALPLNGKKVAVIGAGPSGLSCAYYLALSGYEVNVYDSAPVAGGVLVTGIPKWRLPMEVIQREVEVIKAAGVKIHLNTEIGKDIEFAALQEENNAVYIATGTQFSRKAGVPGEDLPGVTHGLDFLRDINMGNKCDLTGKKVVVIGGGNTAMDASRTARRLGADEVTIAYRRREVDMPADTREVMEAKEEGVKILTMVAPKAFEGDGKVERIVCSKMKLGDKGVDGRRKTVATNEEVTVNADVVIVAVSQYSDFPFISKDEVEMTEWGKLIVNDENMTSMPGVFAGGDVARGSASAIEAIADGKNSAKKIADYLGLATQLNQGAEITLPPKSDRPYNYDQAGKMRNVPAKERVKSNIEVALGLTEEMLQDAAARCFRCSGAASVDPEKCVDCGLCWEHCNYDAIEFKPLEKPSIHTVPPIETEEQREEVKKILKKAHQLPTNLVCMCCFTQAWEVAYSIVRGTRTMQELAIDTGARSGCGGGWCGGMIPQFFTAAGIELESPGDGSWYNSQVTLFTITEDQVTDEHSHPDKWQEHYYTEEKFESAWEKFIAAQDEMKKKMAAAAAAQH